MIKIDIINRIADRTGVPKLKAEQAVDAYQPQGYVRLEAWARLLAAELARDDGDAAALAGHGHAAADLFARLGCHLGTARAAALPHGQRTPRGRGRAARPRAAR